MSFRIADHYDKSDSCRGAGRGQVPPGDLDLQLGGEVSGLKTRAEAVGEAQFIALGFQVL